MASVHWAEGIDKKSHILDYFLSQMLSDKRINSNCERLPSLAL